MQEHIAAISILTPILTPLVGVGTFLVSQLGLSRRIRTTEYYQKRLALITSILTEHRNMIEPETVSALEGEIGSLATLVLNSSAHIEEDPFLDWKHRRKWKRFLSLPKPVSVGAWFPTVCFYIYLVLGVILLILTPIYYLYNSGWGTLIPAVFCFVLSAMFRFASLQQAKKSSKHRA